MFADVLGLKAVQRNVELNSEEVIKEMELKMEKMNIELEQLISTSIKDMWNTELLNLEF